MCAGLSLVCTDTRVLCIVRSAPPYPREHSANLPSEEPEPLTGAQGTSQALKEGSLEEAALGTEP